VLNKEIYGKENTERGVMIKSNLSTETVDYKTASINYIKELPQLYDMYVEPVWNQHRSGIEPLIVYKLSREQEKFDTSAKMAFEKESPLLYFTYVTIPEIDQGILWDHEVSTTYGAFATEDDAIAAAANYTSFRPQLILDTSLWTYRVLLDTGLICPLPSGRYPVAWLIRGG
jgi:hypothetical protein